MRQDELLQLQHALLIRRYTTHPAFFEPAPSRIVYHDLLPAPNDQKIFGDFLAGSNISSPDVFETPFLAQQRERGDSEAMSGSCLGQDDGRALGEVRQVVESHYGV